MAPRSVPRRQRDNVDYSAIGKLGRRTGVALDQRPLDANGMEEISGIFSSPRKPSPLKKMTTMERVQERSASPESAEEDGDNNLLSAPTRLHEPTSDLSIVSGPTPSRTPASARGSTRRRSVLPPRSASPKKSGISGLARKSDGVDIFSARKGIHVQDLEDRENSPTPTPTRTDQLRRFSNSPEKTPLRDIATNRAYSSAKPRHTLPDNEPVEKEPSVLGEDDNPDVHDETAQEVDVTVHEDPDFAPPLGDADESREDESEREDSAELGAVPGEVDDEENDQTFEPEPSEPPAIQNQANSRKKRKSDAMDDAAHQSPIPKVRKRGRPSLAEKRQNQREPNSKPTSSRAKGKRQARTNDENTEISSRQQQELDAVIERVKARPDPPRSLYILRRETPMDDAVTHTRSGRVSIKPLAYWRNERCVYGGSPGSASLEKGARFPLNSIKEIVRTEEVDAPVGKKPNKQKKKSSKRAAVRRAQAEDSESSESDEDDAEDPHAEPWETGSGTLRGNVSLWDQEEQAPLEQEAEVEIAHAPAAIKTREVKGPSLHEGPTFRYAKLLSTRFFGTGLVELPPGGVKRPKNSRKMHMSFFVVQGRVTVTVSPIGGEETGSLTRFSIGKGGYWQVPRGNQYSIQNELDKTARIFFSQGCEPSPYEDES